MLHYLPWRELLRSTSEYLVFFELTFIVFDNIINCSEKKIIRIKKMFIFILHARSIIIWYIIVLLNNWAKKENDD